jgi:glycosyltransferase involved in cell wall biosynthesis
MAKAMLKVSIIIPCFNYGRFLFESVRSVISQTHQNWECLIIDDGSVDNTKEIAESLVRLDSRVKYYYKSNGGLSSTRNYGIEKAKGDFIGFLDADDLYHERKLEDQLNCFIENPQADIVYGNAKFFEKNNFEKLFNSKEKGKNSELLKLSGRGGAIISLLIRKNFTVVSAPLLRRQVIKSVGSFSEDFKSYEDWQFWLRCALAGCNFSFSEKPEVCTYIRFGHESMMSDKKKLIRSGIQLRKFVLSKFPFEYQPYNFYRLLRSELKLLMTR